MGLVTICSVVALALVVEARVVFRAPDVLEVDSQLFIVDEGGQREFRLLLEDMVKNDEGDFTNWINNDHAEMVLGSTGDYEWLREIRNREENYGECMVPCENEDVFAMEIDVLGTDDDQIILEECVELEPQARRPQIGMFCMNVDQRMPQAKCRRNKKCEQYMTSGCQCPDFAVKYFCRGSAAERQQYCDDVVASFTAGLSSSKRSYENLVAKFPQQIAAADADAVANEAASSDAGKLAPVEKTDKRKEVKLLSNLIDKLADKKSPK